MGWENVFACENADFPSKVISHNYPHIKIFNDVRTTDFTSYRGSIDILTGGFPCQPFSVAGLREGTDDPRYLWPQMLRAVREIRPSWVVAENVPGLITWGDGMVFEQVCADLEAENYEVLPFVLPAAGVNAPHKRDRVFIIAHSSDARPEGMRREPQNSIYKSKSTADPKRPGLQKSETGKQFEPLPDVERNHLQILPADSFSLGLRTESNGLRIAELFDEIGKGGYWKNFPTESPVCSGNDGLRDRLEQYIRSCGTGILTEKDVEQIISATISKVRKESIKGYGNAVVPQLVYSIFQAIATYSIL